MKPKDRTIQAADLITSALRALVRINYDNPIQLSSNARMAATLLRDAIKTLEEK